MCANSVSWMACNAMLPCYLPGLVLILILFCLPETLEARPAPLPQDAEKAAEEAKQATNQLDTKPITVGHRFNRSEV